MRAATYAVTFAGKVGKEALRQNAAPSTLYTLTKSATHTFMLNRYTSFAGSNSNISPYQSEEREQKNNNSLISNTTSTKVRYQPVEEPNIYEADQYLPNFLLVKALHCLDKLGEDMLLNNRNRASIESLELLSSNINYKLSLSYGPITLPREFYGITRIEAMRALLEANPALNAEGKKISEDVFRMIFDAHNEYQSRKGDFPISELDLLKSNRAQIERIPGVKEIVEAYDKYRSPLREVKEQAEGGFRKKLEEESTSNSIKI